MLSETDGSRIGRLSVRYCGETSGLPRIFHTLGAGGDVRTVLGAHSDARLGILKLDAEDSALRPSTDGRLENAYMEMARRSGLNVATCHVISDSDEVRERHHLFVDRFDVITGGEARLHVVTLAGALETFRRLTYDHLLRATRELTGDMRQVREAVRRMVFNVRAGNGDDHGKNHSFTFDRGTKTWALSPAYDLTLNHSVNSTLNGLSSTTFGKSPTVQRMAELAANHGIKANEFAEIDDQVSRAVEAWPAIASGLRLPEPEIERAAGKHALIRDAMQHKRSARISTRRRRW